MRLHEHLGCDQLHANARGLVSVESGCDEQFMTHAPWGLYRGDKAHYAARSLGHNLMGCHS